MDFYSATETWVLPLQPLTQTLFLFLKTGQENSWTKSCTIISFRGRLVKSHTSVSCQAVVDLRGFGHQWTLLWLLLLGSHPNCENISVDVRLSAYAHPFVCLSCSNNVWTCQIHTHTEAPIVYDQSGTHPRIGSNRHQPGDGSFKVLLCHMFSHVPPLREKSWQSTNNRSVSWVICYL